MSKKSSARTGSDGDAESTFTDVLANIRSGSSSGKSKRELEGGPFGDSPCENTQLHFKDYFILMFQDDDTPTETSEGSDIDQELYDLQNDYLEKLNIVRKTLDLLEIPDKLDSLSPNSSRNKCIITEIVDEETISDKSGKNNQDQEKEMTGEESLTTRERTENIYDDKYDVIKIYPIIKPYNFGSGSTTSIFDVDYNPPKKKICHREKTPRHTSVSEGNLPYYTRVALHDELFIVSKTLEANNDIICKKTIETKETQYTEEDFKEKPKRKEDIFVFGQQNNVNLYPEVVIKYETENASESSSSSSLASIDSKPISNCSKTKANESLDNTVLSLNLAEVNSDNSFTTTTYSTTIDSPKCKKKVRKRFGRRNKVSSSEKITLWEEIRKLHSTRQSKIELANDEKPEGDSKTKIKEEESVDKDNSDKLGGGDYISQYLRYKRQMDVLRPYVPFGTTVPDKHAECWKTVEEHFCRSGSSSGSHASKKQDDCVEEDSEKEDNGTFWRKSCFCCWSKHK